MNDGKLPRNKQLKGFSTRLRNDATKEERKLWYEYLRKYPVQFNRQRIIGNYIVDFYCPRAKLAVELDGSQHYEKRGKQQDDERTYYLNSNGITVLRFSNLDINTNLEGVCTVIDTEVKRLLRKGAVSEAD